MIKLNKQLQIIGCNSSIQFGGFDLLFFGDFLQFPTVSHMDLYIDDSKLHKHGHDLWRSLNAVVILHQQMRQAEDPIYAALLCRLRIRQSLESDIALLYSRIGAPLPSACTSPVVTRRHIVRNAINNIRLVQAAQRQNVPITYCVAKITKTKKMHLNEIYEITYMKGQGNMKAKADAILAVVPGAPLMITTNIDVSLGKIPFSLIPFLLIFKFSIVI